MSIAEQLREEGKKEGMEKGRQEGRQEGVKKVVKNAIVKGMEIEDIIDLTGLSEKEIEEIRKEMLQ